MSYHHVQRLEDAGALASELAATDRFALDCEAAGFHRYSDRLCLVQITVAGGTWVVDPLAFDPTELLRAPVEDPAVQVVMHGADFDLRLLKRDLGLRLRGLLDTQIAASLLGEESIGLQSLLEARLGVRLSKKFQRADWANRPLSDGMLEYAASDTRYLEKLADLLLADLRGAGRLAWAEEEWRALEGVADDLADEDTDEDPVVRVKGARRLPPRAVAALREALIWRDGIARAKDRAPFRVVADAQLVEAVLQGARTIHDLKSIKGFPRGLASDRGAELLGILRRVEEAPESELAPYPKQVGRGPGRPPPEVEALVERLKGLRNRKADEVGLPRGTLLPNAVLEAVARDEPKSMTALLEIDGMRRWRADILGAELIEAVRTS